MRGVNGPISQRTGSGQAGQLKVSLLGVLAVLAIGVAASSIFLLMQERDKRQAKEHELRLAVAQSDELKVKLNEAQQAKAHVDAELVLARRELDQSKQELAKAVEARETLVASIEARETEISRLTKNLEQAQNDSKQIASQLTELQSERDAAKKQLADLQKAKGELESKVMELSGQPLVELEKVRVASDQPAETGKAVAMPASASSSDLAQGQVVVINREYDFIVMNMGRNRGLSVGQEFQIVRGDEVLGKVKVEKVYDELSAAAILPESQKNNIREGDSVRAL